MESWIKKAMDEMCAIAPDGSEMNRGSQVRLVNNNLKSLTNRRSKSGKISVGTQGVIVARRSNEEYLVKFISHGGIRFVTSENIELLN